MKARFGYFVLVLTLVAACAKSEAPKSEQADNSTPPAVQQPQTQTNSQPQATPDARNSSNNSPNRRAAADQRFSEGTHYTVLTPAQPITGDGSAIEVAEIFAYSCTHCFTMESYIHNWYDGQPTDVELVQIPVAWGGLAELHAKAFYTAEALGKLEQTHIAFFKEFHERRNFLNSEEQLVEFFARYDVDEKLFRNTFNSFGVNSKLQRAQDLTRRYQISETPMIVVNGKYVTRGSLAGTHEKWFEIINELVDRERAN